jgi:hypothetical protein
VGLLRRVLLLLLLLLLLKVWGRRPHLRDVTLPVAAKMLEKEVAEYNSADRKDRLQAWKGKMNKDQAFCRA